MRIAPLTDANAGARRPPALRGSGPEPMISPMKEFTLKPDPEDLPKIEAKIKNGLPEETSSQAKAGKKSGDGG